MVSAHAMIVSIVRMIERTTCRAHLACIRRIHVFYANPCELGFILNEMREPIERPCVLRIVVFTAFSCRATVALYMSCDILSDALKGFKLDCANAIFDGKIYNFTRQFVINVPHDTRLFVIELSNGGDFLLFLKFSSPGSSLPAHGFVLAAITCKADFPVITCTNSRAFDAQINAHNTGCGRFIAVSMIGDLCNPLSGLLCYTQRTQL